MGAYDNAPGGPNDPNSVAYAEEQDRQRNAAAAEAKKQAEAAAAQKAAQDAYNGHFQYGGYAGGANNASMYYGDQARQAQQRKGEQIDYSRAQGLAGQAQQNAGMQGQVAQQMWARAQGLTPSIAGMRADQDMRGLMAAQSSAAAGARGPAAMALAQQGAAANTAQGMSQISNMAQVNSAQERQAAEQAAFGAFSGMRGQDFQGQGLEQDAAQKQAAINAQQRAQNDQFSLGLYGNEVDINKAQLGAQGNQIAIESGAQQAQLNRDQAQSNHDSDEKWKYIGAGAGLIGAGAAVYGSGIFGNGSKPVPGQSGVAGGGDGAYSGDGNYYGSEGNGIQGDGSWTDDQGVWHPSDVTAKQNIAPLQAKAWDEGRQAAIADLQKLAGKNGGELKAYGDNPMAQAVRQMKGDAWDEGHRGGDPVTAQFAQGLAPSSYDYKPGIEGATPGRKVGPMAQNMASNPITGTAIRQDPRSGLLGIDGKDGLKVALAAGGHLAQKQQETDAKLAALAAMMKQQQDAQGQGLLAQGPSIGGGADPRLAAAKRMLEGQQEQQGAQLGAGPSVGSTYLDYVRGQ